MIRHILFWNYTKEVKENHLEKETLQKLKESVQTLEGIEGLLCVEMEENLTSGYDLVFYSALKNFQNHSLHEAHKKRCRNLVCERLCGDIERWKQNILKL